MANEVLSYLEMCQREGLSLQKGMNFRLGGGYSVILMSVRPGAPYRDEVTDNGTTLIYEGHDTPRSKAIPDPKARDQPTNTPLGTLTENGKFHHAAQAYRNSRIPPEKVRVYEKLRMGIWSYNGLFHLVDSWQESDGQRKVYKFKLVVVDDDSTANTNQREDWEPRRVIPTAVKIAVWKRDGGHCVVCGATDELHFDHIIPYSRGGTSLSADNVQLLCARHNLEKRDKIQ